MDSSGDDTEGSLPHGTRTAAVAYRLVGGLRSQDIFLEKRKQELEKLYHLELSNDLQTLPHLIYASPEHEPINLNSSEKTWVVNNDHAEYVLKATVNSLPKKVISSSKTTRLPAASSQ
jgi:hypothetical protein